MADLADFSQAGIELIRAAKAFCLAEGGEQISSRHLFRACVARAPDLAAAALQASGVPEDSAGKLVQAMSMPASPPADPAAKRGLAADALEVVDAARKLALQRPEGAQALIAPVHLWAAVCAASRQLDSWLRERGWPQAVVTALPQAAERQLPKAQAATGLQLSENERDVMRRLCQRHLSQLARGGTISTAWGVDDTRQSIVRCLLRRDKRNVVLTGRAGVGKTKLVEDLACRIASGAIAELAGCEVFELDLVSLTRGTHLVGSLAERFAQLTEVLRAHPDHLVLFIDEIHMIMGVSMGGEQMDLANALKPLLVDSRVRVIGATTTEEYTRHIEKDPALSRRFSEVKVPEPDRATMMQLLSEVAPKYEAHHGVAFTPDALRAIYDLTQRYLPNQAFPSKGMDLLDEAGVHVRMRSGKAAPGQPPPEVTARDVGEALARVRGIAIDEPTADLAELLQDRVVGQDTAAQMLADAVITSAGRFGARRGKGPRATILFVGPPGVGKSYMAEALSDILSAGRKTMLAVDMAEFAGERTGEFAKHRLLGPSAPYVGWQDGGLLTSHAMQHPTSVVLLDEIDKAGGEARNLLLKILNDGWVQDGMRRIVSFEGIIFILTSNGARELWERRAHPPIGFGDGRSAEREAGALALPSEDKVRDELKREGFAPELLSRVSHLVMFGSLDDAALGSLVRGLLDQTRSAALEAELVLLEYDPQALAEWVLERAGPDRDARRVAAAFERGVETPLARWRWRRTGPADPVRLHLAPGESELKLAEDFSAEAKQQVQRALMQRLARAYSPDIETKTRAARSAGARIAG